MKRKKTHRGSVKLLRLEGLFIKNDHHIPKRFLGAFKVGHRPSAKEFIDEDLSRALLKRVLDSNYTDAEAVSALDYLTRFNNEFHKNVISKTDPNRLHRTEKQVRSLYSRENSKNRDVMSVRKGSLECLEECCEEIVFVR